MADKRQAAKIASDGYLQVEIVEAPGCLARLEAWLAWAAGYVVVFGLGFLVGVAWEMMR